MEAVLAAMVKRSDISIHGITSFLSFLQTLLVCLFFTNRMQGHLITYGLPKGESKMKRMMGRINIGGYDLGI
jgi:hypothetical protein